MESILFGSIAVALGKATPEQVREALELQRHWADIGVRKLIGQVLREKGRLDDRGIREVLRAQAYKTKRLESKDYARIAVECGFVTAERVREALAGQKTEYRSGEGLRSVGRILIEKGWIERQQHEAVMRALNRVHGRTLAHFSTTAVLYGVKECPVCFEMIDFQAERCDRCATFLGEVTVKPACPTCRATQEPGGEWCAQCGANLVTGLAPAAKHGGRCSACGHVLAEGQDQCYRCGTRRAPPFLVRAAGVILGQLVPALGGALGKVLLLAALAGIVAGLVWLPELARGARALALGGDRARLDEAIGGLRTALLYADDRGVRAALASEWEMPPPAKDEEPRAARERLFRAVLQAPMAMEELEVLAVELDEARVDGDEATAYAEVQVRYRLPRNATPETVLEDVWTAMQSAAGEPGRKIVRRKLTWRWRRHGDRWVLKPF